MKTIYLLLAAFCSSIVVFAHNLPITNAMDTLRYTAIQNGVPVGERIAVPVDTGFYHKIPLGPKASFESWVSVNKKGIPTSIRIQGFTTDGPPWSESFTFKNEISLWNNLAENDSLKHSDDRFYVALKKPYFFDIIFQALMKAEGKKLPLLPAGEASLEYIRDHKIGRDNEAHTLKLFAIHGLGLTPGYVWVDEHNKIFADDISIRQDWEDHFMTLYEIQEKEISNYVTERLRSILPSEEKPHPLVIHNARIFDPHTKVLGEEQSVLISEGKIIKVGDLRQKEIPLSEQIIDAKGKTLLPGLWDMHVHFHRGKSDQVIAPIFIASGITTVRDLGGNDRWISQIKNKYSQRQTIAPRILPSLIMYGNKGAASMGVNVRNSKEVVEAIEKYSELGYVQAKIYNTVPDSLVSVIADEAHRAGMRVSGHLPHNVTGREAIEAGYDEIQHLMYMRLAFADLNPGPGTFFRNDEMSKFAAVAPDHPKWQEFISLLKKNDVAIDPTLLMEEAMGVLPFPFAEKISYNIPAQAFRDFGFIRGPFMALPISPEINKTWVSNGPAILKALYKEEIPLIVGSDAFFGGFELARELELFVEAGIPAPEVLSMATLKAAEIMKMDEQLGSIEAGKIADIILVEGNPLENISDIRNISVVIKDGVAYDPEEILKAFDIAPK